MMVCCVDCGLHSHDRHGKSVYWGQVVDGSLGVLPRFMAHVVWLKLQETGLDMTMQICIGMYCMVTPVHPTTNVHRYSRAALQP